MIDAVVKFQFAHFLGYRSRRAHGERVAIDRLSAPVATVRTTPTGYDIEREIAMRALPRLSILLEIDKITGREGQAVEIAHEASGLRSHYFPGFFPQSHNSGDSFEDWVFSGQQVLHGLK